MVASLNFEVIASMEKGDERNTAVRRAFLMYTPAVEMHGNEADALTVLLNLTHRRDKVDDLFDQRSAKATLANAAHITKCLEQISWLHSHNLKHPDIRVSKQRVLTGTPPLVDGVVSSANCAQTYGWAHNSANVNLAKLFISNFLWKGQPSCLALLLKDAPTEWKTAFRAHGYTVKQFVVLCERIEQKLECSPFPESVDFYSPQLRMPYQDGYCSITPVVSHALLAELQQAAMAKKGQFTAIEHSRPSSLGDIGASLGGRVNALYYPPNIGREEVSLFDSRLNRFKSLHSVCLHHAISGGEFSGALLGLLNSNKELALRQRRLRRIASIKTIRHCLAQWLAPLLEWRSTVAEGLSTKQLMDLNIAIANKPAAVEIRFLTQPITHLDELLLPLCELLNSTLSNDSKVAQFAFHPRLIAPLKHQLKWILKQIRQDSVECDESQEGGVDPTVRFLYLKDIQVFNAQALANPYCVGIPSMAAVWGMLHNYQRKACQQIGINIRFSSFAWFIRTFSMVKGKMLPELSMQGQGGNDFRRPAIQDNRFCDMTCDFVVEVRGFAEELDAVERALESLKSAFPARLAGGSMFAPELSRDVNWCSLYRDKQAVYKKLKGLPASGKWVAPASEQVESVRSLLAKLRLNTRLRPAMLGYMFLGTPEERNNSLERRHAYAEPALGLVECLSAIDIRFIGKNKFMFRLFWALDPQPSHVLLKEI